MRGASGASGAHVVLVDFLDRFEWRDVAGLVYMLSVEQLDLLWEACGVRVTF